MAHRATIQTTYQAARVIKPIYTGGSVASSADGRILATTIGDDALLTDPVTGQELARIEGDGEAITTLALTPSASHLIICSRSYSMRIFSLSPSPSDSLSIRARLDRTLKPHTAPVVTSTIDKTGTLLATGGSDGIVKVWDIRGGYNTHTLHGHGGVVSALCFFEVNPSAADVETEAKKKKKRRKSQPDADDDQEGTLGYRLASGGEDGKIRIWNLHKRNSIATLESHVSVVRSLSYSPEENALASASRDKTVIVWDARTWKIRSTIAILESVESAGFIKQGSLIYSGGENGIVRLWSVASGGEVTQPQSAGSENDSIVDIIHHQGQQHLLAIQADQTLVFYSIASLPERLPSGQIAPLPVVSRISGTHDEIIDMALVGQSRSRLALATNSEDIRIISTETDISHQENDELAGRRFGSDIALLKGHEEIIICLDTDWSGHWLATGAKDNTARLWRLDPSTDTYTCWSTFTGHAESIGAIALPSNPPPTSSIAYTDPLNHPPTFLLTGSEDKTVKNWDIPSQATKASRAAYTRAAHDKDINALDISPNSDIFASASQDRTVKLWNTTTGDQVGTLRGHRRGVWTVKFAPTGVTAPKTSPTAATKGLIATGSGDKTVKIWSLADYTCVQTFEGHANSVLKVLWLTPQSVSAHDRRGAQVASAAGDGLVKVWDLSSGEVETTLDNHTDRVWALAANRDTNALLSGGADGVLTFWTDTTSTTLSAANDRETQRVEQEQQLQNFIHSNNYREAIVLALQLDQPMRLYKLLQSVVDVEDKDPTSLSGIKAVDEVLASLADEQIFRLLVRIRDWNTNARTSQVAQAVLSVLVKTYPAERLASLDTATSGRRKGGIASNHQHTDAQLRAVLDALRVWTERHYRRVEELVDDSYLLEFTLAQMDDVLGVQQQNPYAMLGLGQGEAKANPYMALGLAAGEKDGGGEEEGKGEDIVMLE